MKPFTVWSCVIAAWLMIARPAAAEDVSVSCSLDRDENVMIYTGIIIVEPRQPWLPLTGFYVNYTKEIFGTDAAGPEETQEYLSWPQTEITDQFVYDVNRFGGCDTPSMTAFVYDIVKGATGDQVCWDLLSTCYLRVSVVNGEFGSEGNPSGYYPCNAGILLCASPYENWCFDGWTGDVSGGWTTDECVTVWMEGEDKAVAASFTYCPQPCDPATDPNCPCDPTTDPTCGPCDPWDPECANDPPIIGNPINSPIVINFGRGDYQLTGKNSPVLFDMQATGTPLLIGWTAPGADEAFLSLDRNGNGTIDDGSELFGTATRLQSGAHARNGFQALAEHDENHDGFIDDQDAIWSRLLLWRDENHDGVSQRAELSLVKDSGLQAIRLQYHWSGRRDVWGNTFRYEALAWIRNGVSKAAAAQPIYDIFFVRAQ